MRHAVFTAGIATIGLGLCAAARAAPPPAQLLGKSVTVTWSEDQTRVSADRGTFNRTFQQKVGIYISTKGQVFTRRTATSGRGNSGTQERLADGANMSTVFQSGALVVTSANKRGLARRIVVQLDQQSARCTAQVIVGIAGGGTARMKGIVGGQDVEVKSMTASAVTCAVTEGNVLAP
jgi:hypothetical protein